ncbi:pyrroloquinoline quinone biosynthesis protein PqqF [Pseudomonas sp. SMSB3]|uniref:pyrroloquinoline quinone biosynthesis protein PqqF n=1 Tax=unclassified Pseudomonas TaxID=196821 RepID=UPI0028AA74C7|nr:pyrroloquinoline quinone biosynthesis protein PqqF [Pseudomonas sp.]
MPDPTRHLILPNGLTLKLRQASRLKRSAAALRVQAGSHDASPRWPGLAHFLEHLFFLGTERFPLHDGLMRYVQALGGQVNASTRERTTDFFFETPPAALAGGLERLCQMLAEPDLGIARQRREREVIHAEFIAWSRNPQAQQQFALLQALTGEHPLRAFHAGNRYSLPLNNEAFQQALNGFHQRFYQAGQITLSLCGPQSLDELEQLGRQYGGRFEAGTRRPQSVPPPLACSQPWSFAHEGLPDGAEQALELLLANLRDTRPGSWLDALQRRGWLRGFAIEKLYAFAGQLYWHIDLKLSPQADAEEASRLLQGWFDYLRQVPVELLANAFASLQQRHERSATALDLARRDCAGLPFAALDAQGRNALCLLLEQLPRSTYGSWQLPDADPLMLDPLPAARRVHKPHGLWISDLLPATRQFAALYLRWQLPAADHRLQAMLAQALQPLQARCEQASVHLRFSAIGDFWQLRCAGHPAAVLRATQEALAVVQAPNSWQQPANDDPALIPIRALLERLPDAVLGAAPLANPPGPLDQALLDGTWRHSRWQGLAVGFDPSAVQALSAVLQNCPGHAGAPSPAPRWPGRRWQHAHVPGSENALLLFCALPPAVQGSGRLLAQHLQGPVYQRLRVELQLGYAVFSAFRQVEGVDGLLFGVQSPHAGQVEILDHLCALLGQGVTLDVQARQQLAEQFAEPAMANPEVAEWAWQCHLGSQPADLPALQQTILNTQQADLDGLLSYLQSEHCAWLCLANCAAPDPAWH